MHRFIDKKCIWELKFIMFKWDFLVGGGRGGFVPGGDWGANFLGGASMFLCMIIISICIFDVAVSE